MNEGLFLIGVLLKSIESGYNYLNDYDLTENDLTKTENLILFNKIKNEKKISISNCWQELNNVDPWLILFTQLNEKYLSVNDLNTIFENLRNETIKRKLSLIGEDLKKLKNKDSLKKWLELIERLELEKKQETVSDLIDKYLNFKKWKQIKCWFDKLNRHLYLQKGQLLTIGARPSIWKTGLMVQMAIDMAKQWNKVLFFNLEMDEKVIMDRMLSYLTNTDNTVFKYWTVKKEILEKWIDKLNEIKDYLFFNNQKRITSDEIIKTIKKNKPDVVFIDYLWLLDDELKKWQIKAYLLGEITRNLKITAGETETLIVIASQLNRSWAKEKRDPTIDDLRDSWAIEQDSDVVLLLHRDTRDSEDAKIIIWKNRNWYVGEIDMKMNLSTTSFYETF